MLAEQVKDVFTDRCIKPVSEKMLLSSLYPLNSYLNWFINDGYRITYSEDVTDHTIKTWDDALAIIKEPSVLKLASRITKEEIGEVLNFLSSINAMKNAVKKGKLRGGIVIAEKL